MINMIEKQDVSEYFSNNAESWLIDAYEQSGYNYPTPFHRLRIVRKIVASLPDVHRVVDVGCGGGQLAVALAEDGKNVLAVDQSSEMLSSARDLLGVKSIDVQSRVLFKCSSVTELDVSGFDALTAMGLIGYLPSDKELFEVAINTLRPGGYLLISFRNRLFNLFSLSYRTLKEIDGGHFDKLYEEINTLYKKLDLKSVRCFLEQLHAITGQLLSEQLEVEGPDELPSAQKGKVYTSEFEARQTTPAEACELAKNCGFEILGLQGVHPHLALPGMNKLLPSQVYNRLSDSLLPFECEPLGLLWSSVFIGVFKKKK